MIVMEPVSLLVATGVIEVLCLAIAQGFSVWTEWVRGRALRSLVRGAGTNATIILVLNARRVETERTDR